MSKVISTKTLNPGTPGSKLGRSIAQLLGPLSLLVGEDQAKFEELQTRIYEAIKPRDAIEEILTSDLVAHAWDSARLRRLKAALLLACAHAGLRRVLIPLVGNQEAGTLSEAWGRGEPDAKGKVDKLLAGANLPPDTIMAETLTVKLEQIERIDRLASIEETRFGATLRELDRHKSVKAEIRRAAAVIEDAEFEDISGATTLPGGAA